MVIVKFSIQKRRVFNVYYRIYQIYLYIIWEQYSLLGNKGGFLSFIEVYLFLIGVFIILLLMYRWVYGGVKVNVQFIIGVYLVIIG